MAVAVPLRRRLVHETPHRHTSRARPLDTDRSDPEWAVRRHDFVRIGQWCRSPNRTRAEHPPSIAPSDLFTDHAVRIPPARSSGYVVDHLRGSGAARVGGPRLMARLLATIVRPTKIASVRACPSDASCRSIRLSKPEDNGKPRGGRPRHQPWRWSLPS